MKNLKRVMLLILAVTFLLPFSVNAEEKDPVKIYFFKGDGCPHCEETEEWFDSIEEEYGKYYELVEYEVLYNQDNSELMQTVAKKMGDTASGVPYIVVGKYTYPNGFAPDSMADGLIKQIMEVYESDNRYDVIEDINNKKDYSTVVGIVSILLIGGFIAIVLVNRK